MRNSNCPNSVIFCLTNSISSWPTSGMMISTRRAVLANRDFLRAVGVEALLEAADQLVIVNSRSPLLICCASSAARLHWLIAVCCDRCILKLVNQRDAAGQVGAEFEFAKRRRSGSTPAKMPSARLIFQPWSGICQMLAK